MAESSRAQLRFPHFTQELASLQMRELDRDAGGSDASGWRRRRRSPSFESEIAIETELLRYRVFQIGTAFFAVAALIAGIVSLSQNIDDYGTGATAFAASGYALISIAISFFGITYRSVWGRYTYLRMGVVHTVVVFLLGLGLAFASAAAIVFTLDESTEPDLHDVRWPIMSAFLVCGLGMAALQILVAAFAARAARLLFPFSDEAARARHDASAVTATVDNPNYMTFAAP